MTDICLKWPPGFVLITIRICNNPISQEFDWVYDIAYNHEILNMMCSTRCMESTNYHGNKKFYSRCATLLLTMTFTLPLTSVDVEYQ